MSVSNGQCALGGSRDLELWEIFLVNPMLPLFRRFDNRERITLGTKNRGIEGKEFVK